jgi:small Trp-rich protein
MFFLVVGVILGVLKFMDVAPVTSLAWWMVLVPFGLAVLWWEFADSTGLTKKKEMAKESRRKQEREERNREAIGLGTKKKR